MNEKLTNPEVPDLKINYRQALHEIEQLITTYPRIGKLLWLRLSMKYGVIKP